MKKTLLIFALLICLLFATSCGESSNSDQSNPDVGEVTQDIKIEDESYKVYPQKTKLIFSKTDGLYNYYVFKIGEVARVPLAYYASEYHAGLTDTQYTWSEIAVSSTSISNSEAELEEYTISSEIGSTIKSGFESSIGVEDFGINASIKASLESELSSKIGTESKITTSTENRLDIQKVQEGRREKTVTIEKSSPKGHYWYAICTSCDIYVALACNMSTKTFTYDFITTSVGEKYDAMLYSGERDRLDPDITEKLNFDVSVFDGMNLFGEVDNAVNTVEINLEQYVDTTSDYCTISQDFSGEGYSYSKSTGVLTLYGTENYKDIKKFKLVGNYGKLDSRKEIINTTLENLSIEIISNHDITIELECIALKSNNYGSAITAKESANDINITLVSSGLSSGNKLIQGNDYIFALPRKNPIVDFTNQQLTLMGTAPMLVSAAENCYFGSDGIVAHKLILDFNSNLTVYGGNGINGSAGATVSDGNDGNSGSKGIDGGHAINVHSLEIKACSALKVYGGNGGNGGNGSAGNNKDFNPLGPATPRKGGNGGNGGCGIKIVESIDAQKLISNVKTFVCHGGVGGKGGNGGPGGGTNHVGKGGNGGDGGYGGHACCTGEETITYFDSYNGAGGVGGSGGCNSNDTSKNGTNGQSR